MVEPDSAEPILENPRSVSRSGGVPGVDQVPAVVLGGPIAISVGPISISVGARPRAAIRRWQESRDASATVFLDGSEADVLRAAPCCALGGGRRGADVGFVRNGDPGGCSARSRRRGGGDRGGSTGRGGRGGAPESRPVDDGGGFRPATTAEVDGALWQRERFRLRRSGWTVPR